MKTVRDRLTEMGVTPEAEISRLRAEAKKLLDDYNAEVDEYNAGFDAALAGKTLNDEPNDIRFDVWQAGFRAASYDALRAAVERLAGELEQARAALAAAEEKLTRAAYARTRTDLPVEPTDMTAEAIRAREEAAHAALSALCHGGKFTMTIPVQPDDTDILIGNSLRDILHLLEQLAVAEQRIREEHDAYIRADEQRAIASHGEQYEKARAEAAEQRAEKAEALLRQWQEAHAAAAHMDERWHGSFDVLMATEEHFIMPLPPPVVDLRGGEEGA